MPAIEIAAQRALPKKLVQLVAVDAVHQQCAVKLQHHPFMKTDFNGDL